MKKKTTKKKGKNWIKAKSTSSILPVIFAIALLSLFSETVRTIPVGAKSESFTNLSFELPSLNPEIIEEKFLNKNLTLRKEKIKITTEKVNQFLIEENFEVDKELTVKKEVKIAKVVEVQKKEIKVKPIDQKIVDASKVEEKIELASAVKLTQADTSTKTIIIDGEEKIIPGTSDKNITYIQILQNPNDLDLNLKYSRQQAKAGDFKQTIATLERLNMMYPDNIEIKLYLLSVLVQADSPDKALTVIEEIKENEDLSSEDLETVTEIEEQMKERKAPKLWNFYADVGLGVIQNNNVNSVSKNRLKVDEDAIVPFTTPMHDRTYSSSLGFTATRSVGEASSLMINTSFSDSRQNTETTDDFDSYGLTVAFDTTVGNQSLSPYLTLSKTDNQDDADNFSLGTGIGGYFSLGEEGRHSINYGYSLSNSKNNRNLNDTTADETNAIGHSVTLGHDFYANDLISASTGLGYSISEAKVGANDFHTYDFNLRVNFAFPWAYISIGDALSFNDYIHQDTSVISNIVRSDVTNTMDVSLTKPLGDLLPFLDPSKSLFLTLAYEKVISEANIMNYDYISDSYALSLNKSFQLNR